MTGFDQRLVKDGPVLVIVSGPPGSGKTTLSEKLAGELGYPMISRDKLREEMMRSRGLKRAAPGDEIAGLVFELFFEQIEDLTGKQTSVVVEAAFQYRLWAPRIGPLLDTTRPKIIQCRMPRELLRARYARRIQGDPDRGRFHADDAFLAKLDREGLSMQAYDLSALGPALTVDTSDGYDPALEEIVAFVREE